MGVDGAMRPVEGGDSGGGGVGDADEGGVVAAGAGETGAASGGSSARARAGLTRRARMTAAPPQRKNVGIGPLSTWGALTVASVGRRGAPAGPAPRARLPYRVLRPACNRIPHRSDA